MTTTPTPVRRRRLLPLTAHQAEHLERVKRIAARPYTHPRSGRPLPRLITDRSLPRGSWIATSQGDLADPDLTAEDVCRCPVHPIGAAITLWHLADKGYLIHVANFTTRRGGTRSVYRLHPDLIPAKEATPDA